MKLVDMNETKGDVDADVGVPSGLRSDDGSRMPLNSRHSFYISWDEVRVHGREDTRGGEGCQVVILR